MLLRVLLGALLAAASAAPPIDYPDAEALDPDVYNVHGYREQMLIRKLLYNYTSAVRPMGVPQVRHNDGVGEWSADRARHSKAPCSEAHLPDAHQRDGAHPVALVLQRRQHGVHRAAGACSHSAPTCCLRRRGTKGGGQRRMRERRRGMCALLQHFQQQWRDPRMSVLEMVDDEQSRRPKTIFSEVPPCP